MLRLLDEVESLEAILMEDVTIKRNEETYVKEDNFLRIFVFVGLNMY